MFGIDLDKFIERFAATKVGKEVVKEVRKEVVTERKRLSFAIAAKRAEVDRDVAALIKAEQAAKAAYETSLASHTAIDAKYQLAHYQRYSVSSAGEHAIAMLERELRDTAPEEIAERQRQWLKEWQDMRGVCADVHIATVTTHDGHVDWRTSNSESISARMAGLLAAVREAEDVVKLSPSIDVGPELDAIYARLPKIERPLSDYDTIVKLVEADMEQERLFHKRERDAEFAESERKKKAKQAAKDEAEARQRWQYHAVVPAETD